MSEHIQDYKLFVGAVQGWVEEANEPLLTRAWRLTRACLMAHAVVDKGPGQSWGDASNEAWDDFVVAYNGGEATFLMEALAQDLQVAAPVGTDKPLIVVVEEAYRAASQNPARKRAKRTTRSDHPFTVIQGGDT